MNRNPRLDHAIDCQVCAIVNYALRYFAPEEASHFADYLRDKADQLDRVSGPEVELVPEGAA